MNTNYLSWFKALDIALQDRRDCFQLLSSNVYEPLDMLEKQAKENWAELRRLQSYNNDWGHPVLKQLIAKRYGIRPTEILLTNGCTNATYLSIISQVKPGDTVICETPAYQPMWQTAQLSGAKIKWLKRRPPHYEVDPDELAGLVDRKTSLVILTNLHNPSGAYLSKKELAEIARAVRRRNQKTRILMDEVFRDFVPDRPACTVDPVYISTGSLSKVYGLSHLECGWILADKRTIDHIAPYFVLSDGNGSRYLEAMSAVVFEKLDAYLSRSMDIAARNRRELAGAAGPLIKEGLISGDIPEQSCIWFPQVAGFRDAGKLADLLARRYQVYVVPGKFFGDAGRIRIGFGSQPEAFRKSIAAFAGAVRDITKR
ncbi:MAG: pyridoxal phosphate-dependent aminotransferase [Candidatus Edwardsbacteria bacterium]|nr:pyridoxal phosphate-dependent aminotransferase [Candidatus Edwardsbacteria bacterium]